MIAPSPDSESARPDAPCPDRADPPSLFVKVARLAAQVCEAPIAALSLIENEGTQVGAAVGLSSDFPLRDLAFCAQAARQAGLLIVPDARRDARFDTEAVIMDYPHARFYASAPLVTSGGSVLGSLYVLDRVPRRLTAGQEKVLTLLAHQLAGRIEIERGLAAQERSVDECAQLVEAARRSGASLGEIIQYLWPGCRTLPGC